MTKEPEDKPRPTSMMSEAPGIFRFFVNRDRPLLLRVGVAAAVLFILIYPMWARRNHTPRRPGQGVVVAPTARPEGILPQDELNQTPPPEASPKPADDRAAGEPAPAEASLFVPFPQPIRGMVGIVADDADGSTWIGTTREIVELREGKLSSAVVRLDPQSYEGLFNFELPVLSAFTIDEHGRIWVGSKEGSLLLYENHDWRLLWEPHDPMRTAITAIKPLSGSVYVAGTGLWRWAEASGSLSRVTAFKDTQIYGLEQAGTSLVLTADTGVWVLGSQGWEQRYAIQPGRETVTAVQMSSTGELLVGSSAGLSHIAAGPSGQQALLEGVQVLRLLPDASGNLWVPTTDRGLLLLHNAKWFQLLPEHGLPVKDLSYVAVDRHNRLWIGGVAGQLFVAKRDDVIAAMAEHPFTPPVIDRNAPLLYNTACRAAAKELKLGETSGEISYVSVEGLPAVYFRGRQVCPEGMTYLRKDGVYVRLVKDEVIRGTGINPEKIRLPWDQSPTATEKPPKINALFLDSKDRIWVAHSRGVLMSHDGSWEDFQKEKALRDNPAEVVSEDAKGIVWIGTAPVYPTPKPGEGPGQQDFIPCVFLFHDDKWASLSGKNDLPGWFVNDFLPLPDGKMLVSMNRGVAEVSAEGVKRQAEKSRWTQIHVVNMSRDADGRIWRAHSLFYPGISWAVGDDILLTKGRLKLFSENITKVAHDGAGRLWLESANGEIAIYKPSFFDNPDASADAGPTSSSGAAAPEPASEDDE